MTSYLKLIAKKSTPSTTGPLFVGASPAVVAFGGTAALVLPALLAGDLILIHTGAATATVATQPTATGFTVGTAFYLGANSYRPQLGMLKKTAVGGDSGATVTVTGNAPGTWGVVASVWRNVSALRTGEQNINSSGVVVDAVGVTTVNVNDFVGVWGVYRGGTVTRGIGPIAGYTTVIDNDIASTFGCSLFFKTAGVVGVVNPPAQTTAIQHLEWSAQTFMLAP